MGQTNVKSDDEAGQMFKYQESQLHDRSWALTERIEKEDDI